MGGYYIEITGSGRLQVAIINSRGGCGFFASKKNKGVIFTIEGESAASFNAKETRKGREMKDSIQEFGKCDSYAKTKYDARLVALECSYIAHIDVNNTGGGHCG